MLAYPLLLLCSSKTFADTVMESVRSPIATLFFLTFILGSLAMTAIARYKTRSLQEFFAASGSISDRKSVV